MNIIHHPSPNFDHRREGSVIKWIILHYTELPDNETALHWLCSREKQVSAHYLISNDGKIYQLVNDEYRAWHAGVSEWKGEKDLNHTSIGIELDNDSYAPYPEVQIQTLLDLLDRLCHKHHIPKENILGHHDIAPTRKVDPGPHFPWNKLYDKGFALLRRDEEHHKEELRREELEKYDR